MQDTALYQYLLGLKSPWIVSQQPDPEDQEHGLRVSQHRELQDGDLLPLRRAQFVPMLNPGAPFI
ncbi:MAG: hypothetical protein E8D46_04630 [Nitrospira sp.]|nr:MAG: hypothetical protein E8D46_04630 [Nitrospira sp.]